ncbi:hypothetical protein BCP78_0169 [Bacillus phage BCP78]|uniref:Uncharacterized protein n=3 Tax=Tsarbombavirus BCP78 TaxID=1985182 RepID=J9PRZ5_9CAUD|nr:hypothetical protein BCP78_0169 [Bacillus phage BCP78]YP_009783532.1 hypothetical protein QLX27_gp159 [Bacillus phage BCU4]AEW47176.1 hypothetical protein BCP78_0169 [Bacillus phage BCP78]AEW47665.1 hypothetical protein BCU4_0159 [Bacillus phage BCU4]AQN32544.1 hypothetical protein BCP12_132 [Bacillus phage BCP12]
MNKTIEKWDRIVISQEDAELLFDWRDANQELVRNFNPVLEQGVIINTNTPDIRYVFQKQGDEFVYSVVLEDGTVTHELVWNSITGEGKAIHSQLKKEMIRMYNEVFISLHASLMAYMEHSQDDTESVSVKSHTVVVGHKKQKKSKKKAPVKIRRKVYTVSVSKESLEAATRSYERHIEKWTVRGHWRKTKNGQVWIKPHVRGEGKEVTPKEYQL